MSDQSKKIFFSDQNKNILTTTINEIVSSKFGLQPSSKFSTVVDQIMNSTYVDHDKPDHMSVKTHLENLNKIVLSEVIKYVKANTNTQVHNQINTLPYNNNMSVVPYGGGGNQMPYSQIGNEMTIPTPGGLLPGMNNNNGNNAPMMPPMGMNMNPMGMNMGGMNGMNGMNMGG